MMLTTWESCGCLSVFFPFFMISKIFHVYSQHHGIIIMIITSSDDHILSIFWIQSAKYSTAQSSLEEEDDMMMGLQCKSALLNNIFYPWMNRYGHECGGGGDKTCSAFYNSTNFIDNHMQNLHYCHHHRVHLASSSSFPSLSRHDILPIVFPLI